MSLSAAAVKRSRTRVAKPWRVRFPNWNRFWPGILDGRPLAESEYVRARWLMWNEGLCEGEDYVVEHRDGRDNWNGLLTRDRVWEVGGSSR